MLSYSRVIAVYLATAALVTWGLFAFGWVELIELPGFEGDRPSPTVTVSRSPEDSAKSSLPRTTTAGQDPVQQVARVGMNDAGSRSETPSESVPPVSGARTPSTSPDGTVSSSPDAVARQVAAVPLETGTVSVPTSPPAKSLPANDRKVSPAPVGAPLPEPVATLPKATPRQDNVTGSTPAKEVRLQPAAPAPLLPPPAVSPPPFTPPPATTSATPLPRVGIVAPTPPPQHVAPRLSPPAEQKAPSRRWAPTRRVAGFGADSLVDQIEDEHRPPDDIPCVVFEQARFKATTAQPLRGTDEQIALIADLLAAHPAARVEIGSRIGTNQMTAANLRLSIDRAAFVRNALAAHGIGIERLVIDTEAGYHALLDELGRIGAVRAPSIGLCVLPTRR